MNFQYETDRLLIKTMDASKTAAHEVLRFYLNNQLLFEKYEVPRPKNFYTIDFQQQVLTIEQQLFLKNAAARYYIFPKETPDIMIGTVSFNNIRRSAFSDCQLGYKFDQQYWHKGYACESIDTLLSAIFFQEHLHRVEANVMPENTASCKLLERLDFKQEGLSHQNIFINGKWEDHYRYARLHP